MYQYNLVRLDPATQTPKTTRYNQRRRRRLQVRDDSSDSSVENERWRNNYAAVKSVLMTTYNVSQDEESFEVNTTSSTQSQRALSESSQSENESIQMNEEQDISVHGSSSSHDNTIPVIRDLMFMDGSVDYESEDQIDNLQGRDLREQLQYEQDDQYASDDDFIANQRMFEDLVNDVQNGPAMVMNDEDGDVINARVNVSKAEIYLAVLKFSLVYNLPQTAIADLFKMLNLFFSTSILPDSRYLVDKVFSYQDNVDYHALCPNCKSYVKQFHREQDYSARCGPCNLVFSLKSPTYKDFFSIMNPEHEIVNYLEENWDYCESVFRERADNNFDINEFHSGLLYKQLRHSLPDDKKDNFITVTFNSDGSPVFESSAFSIWPIQIIINELPFKVRTSKTILCGLWYGKNKPNMNIFFEHFVRQMNLLADEGVTCNVRNTIRKIYVYAICSCDDSVARAPMQGLIQFNGYFGCNWCLHPGYYVRTGRGGSLKYILIDDEVDDRNEADSLRHIRECVDTEQSVYGFIKESVLIRLNSFNIISGFVPDSMHLIDLGIAKQFMKYWFDTANMPYSLNNEEINIIDNVLKNLKVPSKALRYCRSIRDKKFWKAKELQNWVLYYSTIVLLIFPKMRPYVEHWSNLVRAYYILLQNNINREQIHEAYRLLNNFVALTEFYYSRSAMTFNVHQLLHLTQSVVNWGPLYCHSGYGFENGNGEIVKQVKAANGVVYQINRIIGMKGCDLILKKFVLQNIPDSIVIDYVRYLETRICSRVFKTNVGRYFGKVSLPTHRWARELNLSDSAVVYKKIVKEECCYLSCNKIRLRSNNSFAKTIDNDFIQIVFFIVDRLNMQEYTVCKSVDVTDIFDNNIRDFQIKRILNISEDLRAINTITLDKICVHMNCDNESYLCPVPNMYSY